MDQKQEKSSRQVKTLSLMKQVMIWIFSLLFLPLCAAEKSSSALSSLYASLDPSSIAKHFAFYELYPKTVEGKKALLHAWELLSGSCEECDPDILLPQINIQPVIELVHRSAQEQTPTLNQEQLVVIEMLSQHLANRKLKGFGLWDIDQITQLEPKEIDLARGLLIAENGIDNPLKIQSYEATIDLMALQILARLSKDATPKEKIRAINDYIFSEMRFRFPPHSLHAKEIDIYTFLPSVLDSRKGVCLGVSTLYLCLAQRLDLELEIVTPPGHIFVRYVDPNGDILNIETTARGIDIPTERFLGIDTKALQQRNIREVIGLAFMNQAAVFWQKEEYQTAISLYEKAKPFFKDDYLLNMFLGFNYLFVGKEKEGKALLQKIKGVIPDHTISQDTISEDYLAGHAGAEAIQAVFSHVDETRNSILQKRAKLEKILKKYPKFRQGLFHLAITYLQLGREKEAIPYLEQYVAATPNDPTAHYYLSAIHLQRRNFSKSWDSLLKAEQIVQAKKHAPYALKELKRALQKVSPEQLALHPQNPSS